MDLLGGLPLTTQQYVLPQLPGVDVFLLDRHVDDSGSFTELGRFLDGWMKVAPSVTRGFKLAQINYSEVEPGAIKALHLHQRQTDLWFVPASDKMLVVLVDCRLSSASAPDDTRRLVLGDGRNVLLRIPPGVAHGCKNLRPTVGHLIYLVDQVFDPDPDNCDEGRLPWDYAGAEVWEARRE